MNKIISDWRVLQPGYFTVPMRWNIPALYAGVVENVQVLRTSSKSSPGGLL